MCAERVLRTDRRTGLARGLVIGVDTATDADHLDGERRDTSRNLWSLPGMCRITGDVRDPTTMKRVASELKKWRKTS